MKMFTRKCGITVLAYLLFAFSMINITYASENYQETVENTVPKSPVEEKFDYEKINYSLNYLGYDCNDEIYCTDFIEECSEDGFNTKVSVLYTENEMIGEYVKSCDEETMELRSCFLVENNEAVFEALTGGNGGCVEVSVEDGTVELTVNEEENSEQEQLGSEIFETTEYQVQINTPTLPKHYLMTYSDAEMMIRLNAGSEGALLNVKNVENDNVNGKGICWAASGASIVNYFNGTNYTARTMYDRVNGAISGTPTGTAANIKTLFDISALKYSYKVGKLTYANVSAQHKKGSPIMCCIQGEDRLDNNAKKNHAVVLCGSFKISTSYGYIFMDPNVDTKLVINYMDYSQITNSSNDLYYYGGGSIFYLKCEQSFYNFSKGV